MSKVVGFIRPPPDIRVIVDKTAAFIGKMGDEFEARIAASEAGNLKFAFLAPQDPYYAYYRHKVDEARSGGPPAAAAPAAASATGAGLPAQQQRDPAAAAPSSSSSSSSSAAPAAMEAEDGSAGAQAPVPGATSAAAATTTSSSSSAAGPTPHSQRAAAIPTPIVRALKSFDPKMAAPREEYTVPPPPYATPEELDVVQLTAQHAATGGRRFLQALTGREYGNPAFDFLKPTHPLFSYFTALVDAYVRVLTPSQPVRELLARTAADPSAAVERGVHLLEYRRLDEEKKRAAAEDGKGPGAAFVDWHDFVVVETIDFDDDDAELDALPAPQAAPPLSTTTGTGGGAQRPGRAGAGAGAGAGAAAAALESAGEMEMEMEMDMDGAAVRGDGGGGETLNIRLDYVPRVGGASGVGASSSFTGAGAGAGPGGQHANYVDPQTGRVIPIEQASEHLRIELLDPAWREQTARAAAKHTTTLYAAGDEVSENLKRLAARRGDIFRGGPGEEGAEQKRSRLG
jgi:splicing factor 3A subunit 1